MLSLLPALPSFPFIMSGTLRSAGSPIVPHCSSSSPQRDSGHSSTTVQPPQPGGHGMPSLGLIRSAMCLPDRPCQAIFTFLPPAVRLTLEGHYPAGHQSTFPLVVLWPQSHTPCYTCSFCCLLSSQRQSHCGEEEAPLPLCELAFLRISSLPYPLTRDFSTGAIESICLSYQALWSGNEGPPPRGL